MKESSILFLCLAFASLVYIGDASGYCHYTYCGYSEYCCGDYLDTCCSVFTLWWFWVVLAGVFLLIAAVSACIYHRQQQRILRQRQFYLNQGQAPGVSTISQYSFAPPSTP